MRHEALLSLAWLLSQSPLVASRSRIVGGDPADVLRYPYYTSLYRDAISDSYFACGGTLVAPDVILTAAHCIDESIRFAVVNNTSLSGDNPNARPRRVLTSFVHPQWDPESVRNDIALLFLDVVVDINPIIYNRKYLAETSESMSIVGLGKLQEQGNFPSTLQDATVLMSDFDICNTAYSTNSQLTFLHGLDNDTQICASSSGIDSCGGDSGGPLLSSTAQQVGIVSFGHGCAREGYPGVYTKVAAFVQWLDELICSFSQLPPSFCDSVSPRANGNNDSSESASAEDAYPAITSGNRIEWAESGGNRWSCCIVVALGVTTIFLAGGL